MKTTKGKKRSLMDLQILSHVFDLTSKTRPSFGKERSHSKTRKRTRNTISPSSSGRRLSHSRRDIGFNVIGSLLEPDTAAMKPFSCMGPYEETDVDNNSLNTSNRPSNSFCSSHSKPSIVHNSCPPYSNKTQTRNLFHRPKSCPPGTSLNSNIVRCMSSNGMEQTAQFPNNSLKADRDTRSNVTHPVLPQQHKRQVFSTNIQMQTHQVEKPRPLHLQIGVYNSVNFNSKDCVPPHTEVEKNIISPSILKPSELSNAMSAHFSQQDEVCKADTLEEGHNVMANADLEGASLEEVKEHVTGSPSIAQVTHSLMPSRDREKLLPFSNSDVSFFDDAVEKLERLRKDLTVPFSEASPLECPLVNSISGLAGNQRRFKCSTTEAASLINKNDYKCKSSKGCIKKCEKGTTKQVLSHIQHSATLGSKILDPECIISKKAFYGKKLKIGLRVSNFSSGLPEKGKMVTGRSRVETKSTTDEIVVIPSDIIMSATTKASHEKEFTKFSRNGGNVKDKYATDKASQDVGDRVKHTEASLDRVVEKGSPDDGTVNKAQKCHKRKHKKKSSKNRDVSKAVDVNVGEGVRNKGADEPKNPSLDDLPEVEGDMDFIQSALYGRQTPKSERKHFMDPPLCFPTQNLCPSDYPEEGAALNVKGTRTEEADPVSSIQPSEDKDVSKAVHVNVGECLQNKGADRPKNLSLDELSDVEEDMDTILSALYGLQIPKRKQKRCTDPPIDFSRQNVPSSGNSGKGAALNVKATRMEEADPVFVPPPKAQVDHSSRPRRSRRISSKAGSYSTTKGSSAVVDLTDVSDDKKKEVTARNVDLDTLKALENMRLTPASKRLVDLPRCMYLKKLSKEEKDLVKRLTISAKPSMKLANIPGAKITLCGSDFKRLRLTRWLNDELINAYVSLINSRNRAIFTELEEAARKDIPRTYVFNTYFHTRLSSGVNGYDFHGVSRWTSRARVDVLKFDLLLVPVNLGNHHWVLSGIDVQNKEWFYWDSLKGSDRSGVCKTLKRWLNDEVTDKHGKKVAETLNISEWKENFQSYRVRRCGVIPECLESRDAPPRFGIVPNQGDGGSCGVFIAKYADCLSLGIKIYFFQKDIPLIRQRMAIDLFNGYIPM